MVHAAHRVAIFDKNRFHALYRRLGRVSFVLIPLILLSIVLVGRGQLLRQAAQGTPLAVNIGGLALSLPGAVAFGTLYVLAMWNGHRAAYHMRYMVGTALLMLAPGTGRVLIQYGHAPFSPASNTLISLRNCWL